MNEITRILSAAEQGDPQAAEQLLPLVYDELRKLAAQKLAQEQPGQTLQATALVHEAYLRLLGGERWGSPPPWDSRRHFFAAAEAMRRILIDRARGRRRLRRGGGWRRLRLGDLDPAIEQAPDGLRARVEALLRAHREGASFLGEPPGAAGVTADESFREPLGTVIGPYRLMELLGEGGMGLVFVAEQERPVRRRFALKIIKLGMDSRQVIARFEAERQALALMDHPNIAKVFDGGTTDGRRSGLASSGAEATKRAASATEGRPYFVMELVRGKPITEYCDAHRLTTGERLKLFLEVCHAVQHAHQKGIIHRDIKPSNVLVSHMDVTPVVKVIVDPRGELDWIVMRALEKDRNQRYESASAFAADVQRYLSDEPVQAYPPSPVYRLRKFTRRNRGRLTLAAVLGIALLEGQSQGIFSAGSRADAPGSDQGRI